MYKVAVLLSTYNGSKYIKEQIDSILSQEGVNIDIYILEMMDQQMKPLILFMNIKAIIFFLQKEKILV